MMKPGEYFNPPTPEVATARSFNSFMKLVVAAAGVVAVEKLVPGSAVLGNEGTLTKNIKAISEIALASAGAYQGFKSIAVSSIYM